MMEIDKSLSFSSDSLDFSPLSSSKVSSKNEAVERDDKSAENQQSFGIADEEEAERYRKDFENYIKSRQTMRTKREYGSVKSSRTVKTHMAEADSLESLTDSLSPKVPPDKVLDNQHGKEQLEVNAGENDAELFARTSQTADPWKISQESSNIASVSPRSSSVYTTSRDRHSKIKPSESELTSLGQRQSHARGSHQVPAVHEVSDGDSMSFKSPKKSGTVSFADIPLKHEFPDMASTSQTSSPGSSQAKPTTSNQTNQYDITDDISTIQKPSFSHAQSFKDIAVQHTFTDIDSDFHEPSLAQKRSHSSTTIPPNHSDITDEGYTMQKHLDSPRLTQTRGSTDNSAQQDEGNRSTLASSQSSETTETLDSQVTGYKHTFLPLRKSLSQEAGCQTDKSLNRYDGVALEETYCPTLQSVDPRLLELLTCFQSCLESFTNTDSKPHQINKSCLKSRLSSCENDPDGTTQKKTSRPKLSVHFGNEPPQEQSNCEGVGTAEHHENILSAGSSRGFVNFAAGTSVCDDADKANYSSPTCTDNSPSVNPNDVTGFVRCAGDVNPRNVSKYGKRGDRREQALVVVSPCGCESNVSITVPEPELSMGTSDNISSLGQNDTSDSTQDIKCENRTFSQRPVTVCNFSDYPCLTVSLSPPISITLHDSGAALPKSSLLSRDVKTYSLSSESQYEDSDSCQRASHSTEAMHNLQDEAAGLKTQINPINDRLSLSPGFSSDNQRPSAITAANFPISSTASGNNSRSGMKHMMTRTVPVSEPRKSNASAKLFQQSYVVRSTIARDTNHALSDHTGSSSKAQPSTPDMLDPFHTKMREAMMELATKCLPNNRCPPHTSMRTQAPDMHSSYCKPCAPFADAMRMLHKCTPCPCMPRHPSCSLPVVWPTCAPCPQNTGGNMNVPCQNTAPPNPVMAPSHPNKASLRPNAHMPHLPSHSTNFSRLSQCNPMPCSNTTSLGGFGGPPESNMPIPPCSHFLFNTNMSVPPKTAFVPPPLSFSAQERLGSSTGSGQYFGAPVLEQPPSQSRYPDFSIKQNPICTGSSQEPGTLFPVNPDPCASQTEQWYPGYNSAWSPQTYNRTWRKFRTRGSQHRSRQASATKLTTYNVTKMPESGHRITISTQMKSIRS